MMIRKLDPTSIGRDLISRVNREFLGSDIFSQSLDDLINYRSILRGFGVDCRFCYSSFSEALYPIDCNAESIRMLVNDELPNDLNELIDWGDGDGFDRIFGILGRWRLYILGENSD